MSTPATPKEPLKPWQFVCSRCQKVINYDHRSKARGWCCKCEVASWSEEKKRAIGAVIGASLRGETDKLPALVDAAKANYDNYRRTAAQNTRTAFTGFYGGLASVKAYEAAERSSTSALESSKLGFQVGTLINIDVLIALDSLINTRSLLQQARYNTILNAIRLKAHAAALSDEDLIAINTLLR